MIAGLACINDIPPTTLDNATITRLAVEAGFPEDAIPDFLCLVKWESGGNYLAANEENVGYPADIGLTQINLLWGTGFPKADGGYNEPFNSNWDRAYLLVPANNVKAAYQIWERNGNFNQWHAFRAHCLP